MIDKLRPGWRGGKGIQAIADTRLVRGAAPDCGDTKRSSAFDDDR
jgi:hypothetical protein